MRVRPSWILALAVSLPGAAAGPLRVLPGEAQLFVDDSRIARSAGLQRTLRQPVKENGGREPVLSADRHLGHRATLQANVNIVFDPRLRKWVMFGLLFAPGLKVGDADGWRRVELVRHTSDDGLNWRSEAGATPEAVFPKSRADLYDEVSQSYAPNVDVCTVRFDESEPDWPYRAWFWLSGLKNGRAGAYFYRSKDGRSFERVARVLASRAASWTHAGHTLLGPSDTTRFVKDPGADRYLVAAKFYEFDSARRDPITDNALRSRAFLYVDRIDREIDLEKATPARLIPSMSQAAGEFPHDEYYDSTAYRYGSHWLGELKVWHGRGDYPWSAAGCAYLKLVSSEDGIAWKRVPFPNDAGIPEVFVANGTPEGGNGGKNDGGYITTFCSPPLRVGDELVFHYGASSYGKNAGDGRRLTGGGIFRARLRLDGFVSVDAGQLTTPAFALEGTRLAVNASGTVRIEALDRRGQPLASHEAKGDGVRLPVVFEGRSLAQACGDERTIALRFTLGPNSRLYSFVIEP